MTNLNIHDILERPAEELADLSDEQLIELLKPFFPLSRTAVLPEMKAAKKPTVTAQAVKTTLQEYQSLLKQLKTLS